MSVEDKRLCTHLFSILQRSGPILLATVCSRPIGVQYVISRIECDSLGEQVYRLVEVLCRKGFIAEVLQYVSLMREAA